MTMKKLLVVYVVALAALVAGLPAAHAGTIALWTFEDGTPGTPATTVTDSVGGFDGNAIDGPVYVSGLSTKYGTQGLSFNGAGQRVEVPVNSGDALELHDSFTIELGLVPGSSGGMALYFGGNLGGHDPYYINVNNNGSISFELYFGSSAAVITTAPGALTFGTYQHVAAVFDKTGATDEMRLFVDNALVASLDVGNKDLAYDDPTNALWFASLDDANNFGFYSGIISDIKISDLALGPDQFFSVPEPTTLAVFGLGLLGLGFVRRRRA